jgi:hypothetical protein
MNMLATPWDPRSLWSLLSLLSKIYLCFLFVASVVSVATLLRIVLRPTTPRALSRLTNVRQFHLWLLLFFGVCLTNELFTTFRGVKWLVCTPNADVVNPVDCISTFFLTVLLTLLLLHSLQWFASYRVEGTSKAR